MVGYCASLNISRLALPALAQWLAGQAYSRGMQRTEVVLTPQSNLGVAGEGAGGVSTHSNVSSEVLLLIFAHSWEFWARTGRRCWVLDGHAKQER